jgi:HSP20 family protein
MARQPEMWLGFREVERFRENLDDMFDRLLGRPGEVTATGTRAPALEAFLEDDLLVVSADLPGVDPEQLEVTITGNVLTIRGTRRERREQRRRDFIHREVTYGTFERVLTLPYPVRADATTATYQNGVLELTMPRSREATRRKVTIEIDDQSPSKAALQKSRL